MFVKISTVLAVLLFSLTAYATPGFRQLTLNDSQHRHLNVVVWYPASSQNSAEVVADNQAFFGVKVMRDAYPTITTHPLLVLSHGYRGNWRNLSWIAEIMAEQGYIVAALDHPGTSTFNHDPIEAGKLWQRPRDISAVINLVTGSPELFGRVDPQRIAALGHSLGGWTVIALAGGRFVPSRLLKDCRHQTLRGDCQLVQQLGLTDPETQQDWQKDLSDPRIKAVVSLDPGLAPGFTPDSLRHISIPVLLLAAGSDHLAQLPSSQEAGYLAAYLPTKGDTLHIIHDATHFSFMQLCKPGATDLIDRESPGEGIVCRDGGGRSRGDIHRQLILQISQFLNTALNFRPSDDGTSLETSQ